MSIAYQTFSTATVYTYIAQDQGFFKDAGVQVTILDGSGTATASALVTSGKSDLVFTAVSVPILTAAAGKQTSIIRARAGGWVGGSLAISSAAGKSIDDLKGLGTKCSIATASPGGGPFTAANVLKGRLGLQDCTIHTFGDINLAVASATAGRDSAVVTSYSTMAAAIAAKKLTVLVDTSDSAKRAEYFGSRDEVEGVDWGLKSTLDKKSAAIAAYLKGLDQAKKWALSHSDEEVAGVLHKIKGFDTRTVEDLTQDYGKTKNYLDVGSENGYISEESWKAELTALQDWKIPNFKDASDAPSAAYGAIVDMGPFKNASLESK